MATSFLHKDNTPLAAGFIHGPTWLDIKRCLIDRQPPAAEVTDDPNVAAAKSHQRSGFEKCIQAIEALPFENPGEASNPFDRPAITETAD